MRNSGRVFAAFGVALVVTACTSFANLSQPDASDRDAGDEGPDAPPGGDARASSGGPTNEGGAGGDACSLASTYADRVKQDGPLAYFRFEELGGKAVDTMGTTASCSPSLVLASLRTDGVYSCSSALDLENGGDSLDCGNNFRFEGNTPFSLEAWAKVQTVDKMHTRTVITDRLNNGYFLAVSTGSAGYRFFFELYNAGNSICTAVVTSGDEVTAGKWYHLAATYDGSQITMTVNGVTATNTCDAKGIGITAAPLIIGSTPSGQPETDFLGVIDEVAIYGKALGEARIAAHFAAGPPVE